MYCKLFFPCRVASVILSLFLSCLRRGRICRKFVENNVLLGNRSICDTSPEESRPGRIGTATSMNRFQHLEVRPPRAMEDALDRTLSSARALRSIVLNVL